ncbi:hypothetical protein Lal_00036865, partial [Lupinus albus]
FISSFLFLLFIFPSSPSHHNNLHFTLTLTLTLKFILKLIFGSSVANVDREVDPFAVVMDPLRLQSLKTKKPLLRMMLMEKTIENIRSNFNSIRTDKSNSTMLDKIEVEYYGSLVNLKSIAQISTPDANSLLVQPYYKSSGDIITCNLWQLHAMKFINYYKKTTKW